MHSLSPLLGLPMSTVLAQQAAHVGDDPFLLFEDRTVSFAEANTLVDQYASRLHIAGARQGTHVAVMMENGPEQLWLTLGISRIGAVCVPVNLAYKGDYLRHVLTSARVDLVVVEAALIERVRAVRPDIPSLQAIMTVNATPDEPDVLALADLPAGHSVGVVSAATPSDLATILFTSGTSGPSKGAMVSNRHWYDSQPTDLAARDIRSDDVFYVSSPMFHAAAWGFIHLALIHGLTVALDRRFSVNSFWDRVRHYNATHIFTMSAMHRWLWAAPERDDDQDNPVRVWAPIPLPFELHEPFKARFGVTHLWFTYGQTEAMRLSCTDVRRPYKPGSAGWARDNIELAVVDEEDRVLPAGYVGELVARPRRPGALMDGYWANAEATVSAFRNLWYHTGDVARIDEDGEVFFLDRCSDYLRVRGENISSFELEATIARHPGVAEVAAFAVPAAGGTDDDVMIAVVVHPDTTLTPGTLCRYCIDELPYFAVPRYIDFVDVLPRTPTNRVQKYQLRARGPADTTWDRVLHGVVVAR